VNFTGNRGDTPLISVNASELEKFAFRSLFFSEDYFAESDRALGNTVDFRGAVRWDLLRDH